MRCRAAACALAVLAAVALLVPAAPARADGDPASDVLLSQNLFLPADADVGVRQETALATLLRGAARAGFPIRVAIIPDSYDLGAVEALWQKPRTYAVFLGIELSQVYPHPLLVVMPNGLGLSWTGHSTSASYRLIESIPIGRGGAGLMDAAQTAVTRIAADAGVKLTPPANTTPAASSSRASGGDGAAPLIAIGVAALLATALGLGFGLHRRAPPGASARPAHVAAREHESRPQPVAPPTRAARAPRGRRIAGRPRWRATVVLGSCFTAAVAGLLLALLLPSHSGPATPSQSSQTAPFLFPEGSRPAPNFHLIDQSGRPVSMAALRGRPVIITFIDPLCRDLCPLAAHVLNQADRDLPPAQRPVIVAVSVDIYADSRADLDEDFDRWSLVPQWRWAVGEPAQLASVWQAYQVGVSVTTKRIAGTLVHYVYHDEIAYVIDRRGYLRALYGWPYDAQQVDQTVKTLAAA